MTDRVQCANQWHAVIHSAGSTCPACGRASSNRVDGTLYPNTEASATNQEVTQHADAIPNRVSDEDPFFYPDGRAKPDAMNPGRATPNREATVEKVALTLAMWLGPSYEAGLLCDSDVTAMAEAVVKVLDA